MHMFVVLASRSGALYVCKVNPNPNPNPNPNHIPSHEPNRVRMHATTSPWCNLLSPTLALALTLILALALALALALQP